MKLIYIGIDNSNFKHGHVYESLGSGGKVFIFQFDYMLSTCPKELFITLEERREQQLNNILK